MNLWKSAAGEIRVRITSADVTGALQAISNGGITINKVLQKDELTVEFRIPRRKLRDLCNLMQRRSSAATY